MNRKEFGIVFIGSMLLLLIFGYSGELSISKNATIDNKKISDSNYIWKDGMGTNVYIQYIDSNGDERYQSLEDNYTIFKVTVKLDSGPTFLMVDLDYNGITLENDNGEMYQLLNQEIEDTVSEELKPLLGTFNWTMFNQAFPGGMSLAFRDLEWTGVLVFPKTEKDTNIQLRIPYNMSGQKARYIECDFKTVCMEE